MKLKTKQEIIEYRKFLYADEYPDGDYPNNILYPESKYAAGNKLLKDKNSFDPNHLKPTLVGIFAIPTIKSL